MVAREEGVILGFLSLVVFPILMKRRAWIEDVIVNSATRSRGVGEKLNQLVFETAVSLGV